MLQKKLQALFNPEQYHGWGRTKRYFEGWYYKVVNEVEDRAFAFIPGIAMDKEGSQQAFVQVLDGKKRTAEYHKFEAKDFKPEAGKFEVKIADNFFSTKKIILDLPTVNGELNFMNQVPWPSSWYSPGIMGPFSFVPFMECYHGILSMNHSIEGQLKIHDELIDFTKGRGYMEKDWGHSFPSAYIWMQTNHFSQPGISLKASVAKIPWMGSSFVGFIAGVWLKDRLIEFTTYNFTKLQKSYADQEKVELVMENRNYRLEILAHREASTALASPISGFMDGRIEESMTTKIEVRLYDKKSQRILLEDTGRNTCLEVAGKVHEIII
ncbi:MAG: tocopherol cyclase [Saprospiraceae bacterium]|jgi:tocopherol cyclase